MPNPNEALKGTEQKLVFRSEEDKQKALDAIPVEMPKGTQDRDAWQRTQDALQDNIESAPVDANYVQGQAQAPSRIDPAAQAPAPAPDGGDWYKPADWTFAQNGQQITIGRDEIPTELRDKKISNAKDLILDFVSTHRYAETKAKEYNQSVSDLQRQMNDTQQKIKDYEKQIDELKNRKPEPGQPGSAAASLPSESEISALQNELIGITDQLEKVDEDDLEFKTLSRSAIRVQAKLTSMKDKAYEARFQAFDQEREQVRRDSETSKKRQLEEERIRAESQKREERKLSMAKTIETFANDPNSQLMLSKSFTEVEKEYETWATDIAATYFKIPTDQVQAQHAEIAVQHFLNRTPALITQLEAQGKLNRTPADLRKYLINTELYMMMQGQELDPISGKWQQHDWKLPDMKTAYSRWKDKKGLRYQDEVNAANKAESELLRIMNPPNVAEQVPAGQGPQAQRDMSKISMPQAETALKDLEKRASLAGYGDLEEWIEHLRRKNPGNPEVMLYDQADEALAAFKE